MIVHAPLDRPRAFRSSHAWKGFLSTLVCEDMFTVTYGRLVLVNSCHVNGNGADPFAVAIKRSGVIVRHIARKISLVCSLFLRINGVMKIETTEVR